MERSDITATDNKEKRWCILRHPDADLIGEILGGKRKVFDASGEVSYSYNFFIPFQDLKLRRRKAQESPEDDFKDYDAMLDERALRSDLHHFIFIHESKDNVKKLLNASWNKALTHRLYAYRDEHGDPVEVSHAEVERFKTVIKRYDFQIVNGEPTDEVREGDRVTVVSGPMAGSDGIIKEIREREGQILLTITFAMFQDKMHVAVPGIRISDVRLTSAEAQQLIQDPVIGHFEDQLIELLCHLHGKKGSHELNKEDQRQLRFLYQYTGIQFDDPANRAKFAALMLICAYLMNDKDEVARRQQEVERCLMSEVEKMSDVMVQGSRFKVQGSELRDSVTPDPVIPGSALRESVVRESVVPGSVLRDSVNPGSVLRDSVTPVPVIPNNDISCYLTMSLFIVTHNPEYRCQVKAWRQSHPDCPLVIRRFLSIAKQIRC
ncbi:hypothetical protein L6466_13575 [Prevotella communis]|uniref:transcription termination/antitermination protein NusG n=1 Tax=Prevotella communis TaxID=2913614 RepID=UPI001EDA8BBA|nr:hypothetical protein [Prevotella communis]UKK67530.1 hypothetical protein L6464_13090 [Prevotella communis]UKK70323.1 hypothetical protein L6466_13575 [Prevotella communis]